jgi:hypothetical protein
MRLHDTLHPDQWLDLGVQTVAHKLKFPIGRDEADRSVIFEATQPYTLMELDVFHLDCFTSGGPPGCLEHDFVIQSQPQLWHSRQIALHLDGSEDLGTEHVARRGDKKVQGLDDIEEYFVLPVTDALASP